MGAALDPIAAAWVAPVAAVAFRPEAPVTERERAVLTFLAAHPRARANHVARGLGCAHQSAGKALGSLIAAGRVIREQDERGDVYSVKGRSDG